MTNGRLFVTCILYLTLVKKLAFVVLVFSTSLLMTHSLLPHSHDRVKEDHEAVYSNIPPKVSFFDYFKIALQLDLGVEHLDHYSSLEHQFDYEYNYYWLPSSEIIVPEKGLPLENNSCGVFTHSQVWPGIIFLDASPFRGPPHVA